MVLTHLGITSTTRTRRRQKLDSLIVTPPRTPFPPSECRYLIHPPFQSRLQVVIKTACSIATRRPPSGFAMLMVWFLAGSTRYG